MTRVGRSEEQQPALTGSKSRAARFKALSGGDQRVIIYKQSKGVQLSDLDF